MVPPASIVRVIVTDTNILINLIHVRCLEVLGRLPGYEFVVPQEVIREVTAPEQIEALQVTIQSGALRTVVIDDVATLELFSELSTMMGPGEAACLSLAVKHKWFIASDERRVLRREALARLGSGRIVNTAGIFLLAIRAGILTVEDANNAKEELEQHRFRMTFGSFRELL